MNLNQAKREAKRNRTTPTWENQLHAAHQLPTPELARHAAVSIDNHHRCEDCFCCAALTVIEIREGLE